jgi:hypothetical protein
VKVVPSLPLDDHFRCTDWTGCNRRRLELEAMGLTYDGEDIEEQ